MTMLCPPQNVLVPGIKIKISSAPTSPPRRVAPNLDSFTLFGATSYGPIDINLAVIHGTSTRSYRTGRVNPCSLPEETEDLEPPTCRSRDTTTSTSIYSNYSVEGHHFSLPSNQTKKYSNMLVKERFSCLTRTVLVVTK